MPPDPAAVRQETAASGHAQQAVLGAGTLNAYFGGPSREDEPPVSIAAPFGRRDESLPLRGRGALLAKLAADAGRVRVLHGLGGCGKTRLALEVAYRAQRRGYEVWWVSAADSITLVTGMRAVGRRLGVTDTELEHGDAADAIWRRLAERREPWLLVIDNIDDPRILAGAGSHVRDGRGWLRPVSAPSGSVLQPRSWLTMRGTGLVSAPMTKRARWRNGSVACRSRSRSPGPTWPRRPGPRCDRPHPGAVA